MWHGKQAPKETKEREENKYRRSEKTRGRLAEREAGAYDQVKKGETQVCSCFVSQYHTWCIPGRLRIHYIRTQIDVALWSVTRVQQHVIYVHQRVR